MASNRERLASRCFERGFSLVELLVVLVILLILSVLLDSQFSTSHRQRALAGCRANLQKIYLALSLYANDNHGDFPFQNGAPRSETPLSLLVPRSTTETAMFICPGNGDKSIPEGEPFNQRQISYAYYMGWTATQDAGHVIATDWQVDTAPKSIGQQIFSLDGNKPGNNHQKQGGNLVLVNGQTIACGPKTPLDLRFPPTVILLNPKP
jgi:prepilin-type N-terminal cleavage/methylation domain-containing protein